MSCRITFTVEYLSKQARGQPQFKELEKTHLLQPFKVTYKKAWAGGGNVVSSFQSNNHSPYLNLNLWAYLTPPEFGLWILCKDLMCSRPWNLCSELSSNRLLYFFFLLSFLPPRVSSSGNQTSQFSSRHSCYNPATIPLFFFTNRTQICPYI